MQFTQIVLFLDFIAEYVGLDRTKSVKEKGQANDTFYLGSQLLKLCPNHIGPLSVHTQ